MAFKPITNPRGVIIRGKNGKAELIWNAGCAPRMNEMLSKKQEIIDSEVLRLCAPMVPKRTGALERSGTLGTVIGSGEVQYIAPYARRQYYNTSPTRSYDSRRGGMWLERMKTAHRTQILKLVSKSRRSDMVRSIIEGVADFFKDCPLLNAGVFRVDALGDEPQEYTIETGIFNPIIETYIDGSSDRRYQFNFGSREYYSMDRLQNIANSTFYEDFANWVEAQEAAGNFPELPEGMHPEQLSVLSSGYMFDESMRNARYQIQLELIYHKEA